MIPARTLLLASVIAFSGCQSSVTRQTPSAPVPASPIVVQGAMGSEVEALVAALERPTETRMQGWSFWEGTIEGQPVVVSKTLKGTANAAAATALALERYHPRAIINQGTSGGHDPGLRVGDIVVGAAVVNIGAFKTGARPRGAGSDFSQWMPMDLLRSDGSAGQDPDAWVMHRFAGDSALLTAARTAGLQHATGRVVEGVIASSDIWNSELDRIQHLHAAFGTSVEEMETAAAAQIADLGHTPFLGVRILSNNITNGGAYDGGTATRCQQFVLELLRTYIGQTASAPGGVVNRRD